VAFAVERASIRAPFFVLNGDTYFTGELARMARASAVASIALVRVPDASRYGTVEHDGRTGRVTGFREKDPEPRGPAWISAGAYLLSEAVLGHLSAATSGSIERDVFPLLVGHGLRAVPYPAATFIDIGTPADYERAATILAV
jgi:NDP-sugar pyrophosphorylase family protein